MIPQATAEGRRSASRMVLVAAIMAVITVAGLLGAGCSVSDAVIGTTESSAAGTTTSIGATAGTDSANPSTTNTTRLVVGGKTAAEYAAEIPDLQKAVDANPNDLTALQNLAVAQYNAGKYPDAGATYQKMLQIKDDPTTHNNYGNLLRDQGKADVAKIEYRKAIAGDSAYTVAYVNLASVFEREENFSEAQKVLDQGIARTTGEDKQRLQDYKTSLGKAK